MRPSRFTEAEIAQALREVEQGTPAIAVCRRMGITQTTFYRWRSKYCGSPPLNIGELRTLREENQRLKLMVANLLLERPGAGSRRK